MEKEDSQFKYVDFASSRLKPFRNHIIPISKVEEMVRKCGSFDCYTTYMRFNREIFEHLKDMKEKTGKRTIAGYKGRAYSEYHPFDMDSEDLGRAQDTAKNTIMKGMRNECAIRLALKIKASGFTKKDAEGLAWRWNKRNNIGLTPHEIRSVVNSTYAQNRNYRYACNDPILKKFCPFRDKSDCERLRKFQIKRIFE